MARSVLADAGFLIALLHRRDSHHQWAVTQARHLPTPWLTCEAALSEAYHLLEGYGVASLNELLRRKALLVPFQLTDNLDAITRMMEKYAEVPMSLADACLVRMTELRSEAVILTTDEDFRIYRRHGRQVVPCLTPGSGKS